MDARVRLTKVGAVTDQLTHMLRSDARDNRERIVGAARVLFAAEGLDVPMREIARRAGVGPATLYRRFPAKQLLIAEVFAEELRACEAIMAEAGAHPDPWHGFCLMIEKVCELHARNKGFMDAFLARVPGGRGEFDAGRRRTMRAIAELAGRAKAAGGLRPDFVVDDLTLMLRAHRGIHAGTVDTQLAASRRFAALTIHAFRAPAPARGARPGAVPAPAAP